MLDRVSQLARSFVCSSSTDAGCTGGSASASGWKPVSMKVAIGAVAGWCSGYASAKFGQMAALCIGGLFVLLQGLAYAGFISIDWGRVESSVAAKIDQNGDGKLDASDLRQIMRKVYNVLQYNVPGAAGFVPAFYAGFKSGWTLTPE
ncbi:MAG: hypothetical protein MHM6MM_004525 [Cercozoa sp. M6MM]